MGFAFAIAGAWAFGPGVWILKKEGLAGAVRTCALLLVYGPGHRGGPSGGTVTIFSRDMGGSCI